MIILIGDDLCLRIINIFHPFLFQAKLLSTSGEMQNFKLRLINQQTGDCTDSVVLNISNLGPQTFPVGIKLKGSERLLMKVKLLSLPSKQSEVLIGEGVVNFDKNAIDNSLRVPIYDKMQGIEEVAICSIDFLLSGFQVEKHSSIHADKSRSKVDQWRDRSDDAVYSQMSYTVQSDRASEYTPEEVSNHHPKRTLPKNTYNPSPHRQKNAISIVPSPRNFKQQFGSDTNANSERDRKKQQQWGEDYQQPFILQNNAYLSEPIAKQSRMSTRELLEKKGQNIRQNNNQIYTQEKKLLSPLKKIQIRQQKNGKQPIIIRGEQNEAILQQLKKYLKQVQGKIKKEDTLKSKRRRTLLKIQEFTAYKSQNNFIKYNQDMKKSPYKTINNLQAWKIVESQIKQSNDQKNIPLEIVKINFYTVEDIFIASFDMLAYKTHCLASKIQEQIISIQIPSTQSAIKISATILNQGDLSGLIGLQQGDRMSMTLKKINPDQSQSILEISQYKLMFDIHGPTAERKPMMAQKPKLNLDISYRQTFQNNIVNYDLKDRVQRIGVQPWKFIGNQTAHSLTNPNLISLTIGKTESPIKNSSIQENNNSLENTVINNQNRPPSIKNITNPLKKTNQHKSQEQSLSEPKSRKIQNKQIVQKAAKKLKPIQTLTPIRTQVAQINSIRNGNRNNYKFRQSTSPKNLKDAWQEILFNKKNHQKKKYSQTPNSKDLDNQSLNDSMGNMASSSFGLESDPQQSVTDQLKSSSLLPNGIVYRLSEGQEKQPYPLRTFTLRISNISITQPQWAVEQSNDPQIGKFVKLSIKEKVVYFTEIIFNGNYNSILWKLDGCVFEKLSGSQKLSIEIFQTINNRITIIGETAVRISRLFFLRNNHIYNGTISKQDIIYGEFTLGFEVYQNYPFEVIEEQQEEKFKGKRHLSIQIKNKRENSKSKGQVTAQRRLGNSLLKKTLKRKPGQQ